MATSNLTFKPNQRRRKEGSPDSFERSTLHDMMYKVGK